MDDATQKPRVSLQAREELARTVMGALGCEMQDDTCDCGYRCPHEPYSYCTTHDDLDVVDRGALCLQALAVADAILTKHSAPSQPVYDEKKIARFLWGQVGDAEPSSAWRPVAAALVAALRGGELTREETNGD